MMFSVGWMNLAGEHWRVREPKHQYQDSGLSMLGLRVQEKTSGWNESFATMKLPVM